MSPESIPRLSEEEIFAIFDVVERRGDISEAQDVIEKKLHLAKRDRTTIATVHRAAIQFFNIDIDGTKTLTTKEVEDIAVQAGYGISRSRVVDLHRLYRLWVAKKVARIKVINKDIGTDSDTQLTIPSRTKEFLPLLHQWRYLIQITLPDQLIENYFLGELKHQLPIRFLKGRYDSEIYSLARQHHIAGTIPKVLPRQFPIEQEGIFLQLKQLYPDDVIWEAEDSWSRTEDAYLNAIASFFGEIIKGFEYLLAISPESKFPRYGLEAIYSAKYQDSDKLTMALLSEIKYLKENHVNWFTFLQMANLILCCGLLTAAIAELPPHKPWHDQVNKLELLRSMAVHIIMKLPEDFSSNEILDEVSKTVVSFWDRIPEIKQKAGDVLTKLDSLQAAHGDLNSKLKALEFRLSGISE